MNRRTLIGAVAASAAPCSIESPALAAATLLASPAFAGPPLTQSAQVESIDGERVITEAVVNGRLTDAESDAAPANELRLVPNWLDESLDRYVNTHDE